MRVVHCKHDQYTHYIGRPSLLGNRYTHTQSKFPGMVVVGTREEAIWRFEEFARQDARTLRVIEQLPSNAVLGCWCHPQACHGDVIIKLWLEIHNLGFKP